MRYLSLLLCFALCFACNTEDEPSPTSPENTMDSDYYFPPITSDSWETERPEDLEWKTENLGALSTFMETSDSRAFIILNKGRIVLEEYYGNTITGTNTFTKDSYWYWASAGKTLKAFVIGKAEADGLLKLDDPTNQYLSRGWTSLTDDQENNITIWHQLTMTSGLDDTTGDKDCTNPECLVYKAEPGTRWAYHNAPYTLLEEVLESATGDFENYFSEKLEDKIGMTGFWISNGFNRVYYSTPRSMARFGLMILNESKWQQQAILNNPGFHTAMSTSSQDLNKSYGYLWWLNGQESHMLPGLQLVINSAIVPDAPDDAFAAMGKNSQILLIIPSMDLVIVRMGNDPDDRLVSTIWLNEFWSKMEAVF